MDFILFVLMIYSQLLFPYVGTKYIQAFKPSSGNYVSAVYCKCKPVCGFCLFVVLICSQEMLTIPPDGCYIFVSLSFPITALQPALLGGLPQMRDPPSHCSDMCGRTVNCLV